MKKSLKILLLSFVAVVAFGCDNEELDEQDAAQPILSVTHTENSNNYKTLKLYTKLQNPPQICSQLQMDMLTVREFNHRQKEVDSALTAKVTDIKNIGSDMIDSLGIKLLVLVDLTLPQSLVDSQYVYVTMIKRLYSAENLFLSFIHADSVSSSYLASDYVMSNYFVSESDTLTHKGLYRAIYRKCCELNDTLSLFGANPLCAMIVFSDGNVYGMDATPIDPDHYQLQTDILDEIVRKGRPLYYFNLDNSSVGGVNDAANFMQLVAERSHGRYMESFDWVSCENDLAEAFGVNYNDYLLTLEYPSNRIFDGKNRLQLYINTNDSSYLLVDTFFKVGTVCNPIFVDGAPQAKIVLQGILLAILLIILIYLIFQFVIPYILYYHFQRKHTTKYVGPNTTLNGVPVGDVCYFCKTPFQVGDRVVAKCTHTMHKSCWKENDYHCTEYGRKCRHGSHYYNQNDLFDPRNASFYTVWLIVAVFIAISSEIAYVVYDQEITFNLMLDYYTRILDIKSGTPEYMAAIEDLETALDQMPSFGTFLGFEFTFCLGFMVNFRRLHIRKIFELFIQSIISGVCGFVFFLIDVFTNLATDDSGVLDFFDWMPWTATAVMSVFCATYHTKLHPKRKRFIGMLMVGVFSMLVWDIVFSNTSADYRLMLFISNLIFSFGLTLSIAVPMHSSENYVLHVSGCIKEMDVAIYKWFKQSASSHVTIGRSIDCGIQTSWDIQGNVAAVHAEIIQFRRKLYLVPLELGVYSGKKMLKVNHRYHLYHGRVFTIGTTTFTFHERDLY
ncbi:MAG: E3 ubiquitin protein ligase [Paludibacteraceae bacterium]|nr:E3 ubiquitin protein ligase [Paludibacteraceae bacterium]